MRGCAPITVNSLQAIKICPLYAEVRVEFKWKKEMKRVEGKGREWKKEMKRVERKGFVDQTNRLEGKLR